MKLGRETTATIKASRYVVVRMEGKTYARARDPSGAAAQYAAGNPIGLVLVFVIVHLTGHGHGFGSHTSTSTVVEHGTQQP